MDYSTDEISSVLTEMGYSAEPDALEEIRQELISEIDDDSCIEEIYTSLLLANGLDLEESTQEIGNEYPEIHELIGRGKKCLDDLYRDIASVEDELEAELADCTPELRESILQGLSSRGTPLKESGSHNLPDIYEDDEHHPFHERLNHSPPRKAKNQAPSQPRLPNFEFDDENQPITLDRKTEKALIDEVLNQKGARRVNMPPPGRAPFKYDPVKRNAQYREAWKKYPAPGELRRQSLRWKIRDIMLKRDIPHLTLIPRPNFEPRPTWID